MAAKKTPVKTTTAKPKARPRKGSGSPFDSPTRPRVELRLAYGSITEVDARALVLGLFQGVQELSRAAQAVDERMDGAIVDIIQRRMFLGRVGEIFILPAARHDLRADLVICAGMGPFDKFDQTVLQTVAENVARTLVRAKVDDFGMALFGATRGDLYTGLDNLVEGFFRGVRGSRARNPLRAITVCETDRQRCEAIEKALAKLYRARRSEQVEVSLEKITLPPDRDAVPAPRSVLLQATQEPGAKKAGTTIRFSVLPTGSKATVLSETIEVEESSLDALAAEVDGNRFLDAYSLSALKRYGTRLAESLVPPPIASSLQEMVGDRRIVLIHDTVTARVPWEALCIDGWFPAAVGGMSRQLMADHMPVARWLEQRRFDEELDVLLIVDPTDNLPGAAEEGTMVDTVARSLSGIRVKQLRGSAATKASVKREIRSGKYDVLHYAGHSVFSSDDPMASGIICARSQILSGMELAEMSELPALVFFDSCESAKVGGLTQEGATATQRNTGLAEAFLRGGVANYVGTHWEVDDEAAPAFVRAFYGALLEAKPIGQAVSSGRRAVRQLKSRDWADYIHYGSPNFVLKFPYGKDSR